MADILNDENFERFRKLIYDESGITFSETNRPILDGRIKEILRANNIETVEEYYKLITSNKEEMKMSRKPKSLKRPKIKGFRHLCPFFLLCKEDIRFYKIFFIPPFLLINNI